MSTYPSVRVLLVRHAQARSDDGSYGLDTPLSDLGRKQAALVAGALSNGAEHAAIYASPAPRCLETAKPLCQASGHEAVLDARLLEFEFDTRSFESVLDRPDLEVWRPEDKGAANGETLEHFSVRVASCVEELTNRHLGEAVVIFTHSGTIDAMLRWAAGLSPRSIWMHDMPIHNASITELSCWPRGRVRGGAPRYTEVVRVGDVTHLTGCASEF